MAEPVSLKATGFVWLKTDEILAMPFMSAVAWMRTPVSARLRTDFSRVRWSRLAGQVGRTGWRQNQGVFRGMGHAARFLFTSS